MSKIFIPVSQLATIIGQNPYGEICPILRKCWEKLRFKDYQHHLYTLQKKHKINLKPESDMDKVRFLSKQLGICIEDKLKRAFKNDSLVDHNMCKLEIIGEINKADGTIGQKKAIIDLVNSLTNRNFGRNRENNLLERYTKASGLEIIDEQVTVSKVLATTENNKVEWILSGRIDAVNERNEIVEAKNRVHKLFGVLRDYEKAQIQSYLKMSRTNHGYLVEGIEEEINIIPVTYDSTYWKSVLAGVSKFIKVVYKLIGDDGLKETLLVDSDHNEQVFQEMIQK